MNYNWKDILEDNTMSFIEKIYESMNIKDDSMIIMYKNGTFDFYTKLKDDDINNDDAIILVKIPLEDKELFLDYTNKQEFAINVNDYVRIKYNETLMRLEGDTNEDI